MSRIPLMAHLIAGYPDASGCRAAARGLVEGGAAYLEVQIPFSDPSADGPAIQTACAAALAGGATTSDAFALVEDLRRDYPAVPVFVMAYASLVITPGVAAFAARAAKAGVAGLIVPDLPFDDDEGLSDACATLGVRYGNAAPAVVSVAAPSMRPERLAAMSALGRPYLYAALRSGITGASTVVDDATRTFLTACAKGGSRVLGGFGIRSGGQARAVAPYVHAVVAGSVFVDAIRAVVERDGQGGFVNRNARDEAIRAATMETVSMIAAP